MLWECVATRPSSISDGETAKCFLRWAATKRGGVSKTCCSSGERIAWRGIYYEGCYIISDGDRFAMRRLIYCLRNIKRGEKGAPQSLLKRSFEIHTMLIGYARVSKADGSQVADLQHDALVRAGVAAKRIYEDRASGKRDDRPNLEACLKSLRKGDVLVVWKLDRLGRNLRHLVNTVQDLAERGIGFKVLSGQGAEIDTTTAAGKLVFGIFAALAEFEHELIRERTRAGLLAARAGVGKAAGSLP